MAKELAEAASESSLSPPPDNLVSIVDIQTEKTAVSSKKRKAEPVDSTIPRPKKRATKKANVDDDTAGDDVEVKVNRAGKQTAKKTTTRRIKVVKNTEPLQERTKNTKHRIGAHVSSAGGKLRFRPQPVPEKKSYID